MSTQQDIHCLALHQHPFIKGKERDTPDTHSFTAVADLLPHSGDMVWLDRVNQWGDDFIEVSATPKGHPWFGDNERGVPSCVGIEYMAQAIAALAGLLSRREGGPIRIGFLLGTRKYTTHVPFFPHNAMLTIRARQVCVTENNFGLMDCEIRSDRVLAHAQLKVIQPDILIKFLGPRDR